MTAAKKLMLAVACLLAGFTVGWLVRSGLGNSGGPSSTIGDLTPPGAAPVEAESSSATAPPGRPPEFVGVIESVSLSTYGGRFRGRVYIRCIRPPDGRPAPTDQYQREGHRLWVGLDRAVIEHRGGDFGAGSLATVWHKSGQYRTNPPGYYADYLVVESAADKRRAEPGAAVDGGGM